jgi:hypothetical protein
VEAGWFKSDHGDGLTGELPVVVCLGFCGRDISDRFKQPVVVKPGDPFQCCKLDGFLGFQWRTPVDHLGLVQTIDRLGQRVGGSNAQSGQSELDRTRVDSLGCRQLSIYCYFSEDVIGYCGLPTARIAKGNT